MTSTKFFCLWVGVGLVVGCASDTESPLGSLPDLPDDLPPDELPSTVPPPSSYTELQGTAVGVGTSLACAIANESVVCWGGQGGRALPRSALGKNAYLIELGGTPTQLAVGSDHACARLADGTARCWGDSGRGKLGDGGASNGGEEAVTVEGLSGVDAVSAGHEHSCAVAGGKVYCWGYNTQGELGDGTTTQRDAPVEVPEINDAIAVSAGTDYSCALRGGGQVLCWGANRMGQVGVAPGDGDPVLVPTEVPDLIDVTMVSAGDTVTCVLHGGDVVCWGGQINARLSPEERESNPPKITVPGISGATFISTRRGHTTSPSPGCAITNDRLLCWERPTEEDVVVTSVMSATLPTSVSVGSVSFCGMFEDRRIKCWGDNQIGILGDGSFQHYPTPTFIEGVDDAVSLWAGADRNCVLRADGTAQCWGNEPWRNGGGALTDVPELSGADSLNLQRAHCGTFDGVIRCIDLDRGDTYEVTGVSDAVEVITDRMKGCARLRDGSLACWGERSLSAVMIEGIDGVRRLVSGLRQQTCILQDRVRCWTLIPTMNAADALTEVSSQLAEARDVAAAPNYLCATTPSGVACDAMDPRIGPIGPIPNTDRAELLAVGDGHACALIGNEVRCWGSAWAGQLGPSSFVEMDGPIPVPVASEPIALSAAGNHTCALLTDGRVQCWGSNLGGTISPHFSNRSEPTQVRLIW
ncbi:MAG: hypothetical protein AAGF12_02440 [Myxococcota bacterium]